MNKDKKTGACFVRHPFFAATAVNIEKSGGDYFFASPAFL